MKLAKFGGEKTKDEFRLIQRRKAGEARLQALGWRAWNEGAPPVAVPARRVCVMHDPDAPLFGSYSQLLLHSQKVARALTRKRPTTDVRPLDYLR